jgi:MYXO-CTERM domain-containing protein
MRVMRISILLGLALVSALPSTARARDIDVDPATFRAALSGLAPGDNVRLAAGDYDHFTLSDVVGTAAMPIVITGPDDRSAVIHADDGPCCNTIQIDGNVSWVVLRNLTVDGGDVDGAFGLDARGANVHHVTVERCTFVRHDTSQQNVAISTKTATAGWVIRENRIIGAGTGMYLGNSDGTHPFVEGLIENNLFEDTIGYNVQIKWQLPHDPVPGASAGPAATIIRHNVFIKTDRPSPDGDRPNLLVGGFPESGANSEDSYQIYGNVFAHNPRESLVQASGRVSIHDNVFLDTPVAAIRLQDHDLPLRRAWVYHNTIYVEGTGVGIGDAPEGGVVAGNLILAGTPVSGTPTDERDNVTDALASAATYVNAPGTTLGAVDFFPVAGTPARGAPLDLGAFAGDLDRELDFNCTPHGTTGLRGAYGGEGENPGWAIAADNKPSGSECASAPPRPDGGVPPGTDGGTSSARDGGGGASVDGSVMPGGTSSGCGCRVASMGRSTPLRAWLPLALVATALVARRREVARSHRARA